MLRDEIHRHVAIELGEVGLDLPETRPLAKLVRLPGEVALPIRHEYARAQPFEGGEALVEAVGGGPGRIADVAAAAQMPLADMRGRIARPLEHARDRRQLGIEPVGLADRKSTRLNSSH